MGSVANNFAYHYVNASHFLGHDVEIPFVPDIVSVIPALDEPLIFDTLESILEAETEQKVLIIVVVNYSIKATEYTKLFNRHVYELLVAYARQLQSDYFAVLPIFYPDMPRKHAGAGLARKVGMDTAIGIFAQVNNQNGIITSLDADCRIEPNYFQSIAAHFTQHSRSQVATIHFMHRRDHLAPLHKHAIDQYELYLRYFVLACRWAGFPYAFQTIGSCFAVRALGYVKNGGMSKKHAGEDFYFLQKMFPDGENQALYNTRVYPSSRLSRRVPFGTGPALCDIVERQTPYHVYAFEAFDQLRKFYMQLAVLYEHTSIENVFPEALRHYFIEAGLVDKLEEARRNSTNVSLFTKRLLTHFNAFQLVKYLNYTHDNCIYSKGLVTSETLRLFDAFQISIPDDNRIENLLQIAENLELGSY